MTLRYRAIIFDLDGTLVDSYEALEQAINFARGEHALEALPLGRIREFVGDGIETLLERSFETTEVPSTARSAFEDHYDEICCAGSRLLDDVDVTIAELAALGVPMAVCTNKPTSFSRKILDALSLAQYFSAIVGPDLAGARKPDAQHVLKTLESTGCHPSAALFVGDMPIDVAAARNSGLAVAVVSTGSSTLEQLQAAGADHYLARFSDLLSVVRNGADV
jgi:phosphoglycolate phosphatase